MMKTEATVIMNDVPNGFRVLRTSRVFRTIATLCACAVGAATCGCATEDPSRRRSLDEGQAGPGGAGADSEKDASGGSPSSSGGSSGSGGMSSGGTGTGSGGTVVTGGTGGLSGDGTYCSTKIPEPVPLVVSQLFVPNGFMGDYLDVALTERACPTRSSLDASGECYTFDYEPAGAEGWAGVAWQYPGGNWGESPGLCVASGATRVGFWVRGQEGGIPVTFAASGVALGEVLLQEAWTYYEVSLAGLDYNQSGDNGGVVIGFSWAAPGGDGTPKRFYIDDIRWLP